MITAPTTATTAPRGTPLVVDLAPHALTRRTYNRTVIPIYYCAWEQEMLDVCDEVIRVEAITPSRFERGPSYAHLADEQSMSRRYRIIDRGTLNACEVRRLEDG